MIELSEEQLQAMQNTATDPPRFVHPCTGGVYVLVRIEEYERLTDDEVDYSPWTPEEMELLAWQTGELAGWAEMDEYDNYPEKP